MSQVAPQTSSALNRPTKPVVARLVAATQAGLASSMVGLPCGWS